MVKIFKYFATWQGSLCSHTKRKIKTLTPFSPAKAVLQDHRALVGQGRRMAAEMKEAREALWQEELDALLVRLKRGPEDIQHDMKSAVWKIALAAAMKDRTTATNRWLGEALNMGGLHEVSRQVGRWKLNPDARLSRKLA